MNDARRIFLTASSWKISWYSKTFISKLRCCFWNNFWRRIEWLPRIREWISLIDAAFFDRGFGLRIERRRSTSFWYAACCDFDNFGDWIAGELASLGCWMLIMDDTEIFLKDRYSAANWHYLSTNLSVRPHEETSNQPEDDSPCLLQEEWRFKRWNGINDLLFFFNGRCGMAALCTAITAADETVIKEKKHRDVKFR